MVDLPLDHQTWWLLIRKDGNVEQVSIKVTENLKETRTTEHDGVGLSKTDTVSLIIWYNCECVWEREREGEGGRREREIIILLNSPYYDYITFTMLPKWYMYIVHVVYMFITSNFHLFSAKNSFHTKERNTYM